MRKLLLFSFLYPTLLLNVALSQSNNKIVLKYSELELISVKSISDIFTILPHLDLYTVDGYRHTPLLNGLSNNVQNNIKLLINGAKTHYGIWNKTNISQFPVHPSTIDSIIIFTKPVLYKGIFSSGVLIDIITKVPAEGISFNFSYATGNEAGDPGPYRYTKYESENVDQLGPYTFFSGQYSQKNFSLIYNLMHHIIPSTDMSIIRRSPGYNFYNYQLQYINSSIIISGMSELGKHELFGSYSMSGDAVLGSIYGADLIFIDELSREIPYQNKNFILTSSNVTEISPDAALLVDLNLNYNSVDQSKLFNEFQFNHDDLWLFSKIGYNSSIGEVNFQTGASLTHHKVQDKLTNFNFSRNIPSLFISANHEIIKNIFTQIDAVQRFNQSFSGMFVCLDNELALNEYQKFSFSVSYDNLFSIPNSFNYRSSIGFTLDKNYNSRINLLDSKASQTSLKASYNLTPAGRFSIQAGIDITRFQDFSFLLNDFIYYPEDSRIRNAHSEFIDRLNGWTGELNLSITNKVSEILVQKFYYRYKSAISSDKVFEEAMKRFPRHKIFYVLYYLPYEDLRLFMTVNYSSVQKWIEYRNISPIDDMYYKSTLENLFLINCGLTKTFWSGRFKISATVENLLNTRIQYHPVGGSFDLTFFIKAEVDLQSIIQL